MLVVGWKNMGPLEWTGMAGGPVLIYVVRTISTTLFDYRISTLSARLKVLQVERNKTIQKLKDATKYDSTLELLEKYGGSENKPKRGKKQENGEGSDGERKKKQVPLRQGGTPGRTNLPPPPTANIQRHALSAPGTPQPRSQGPVGTPVPPSPRPAEMDASAEFAPNAFDSKVPLSPPHYPPAVAAAPTESHWYDRILDTLLGEDETAAKNRIVLICSRCRLVNGQAPPGTKSLAEIGTWKCMACGGTNGEVDEGRRIVQEVLEERPMAGVETTKDDGDEGSSDHIEADEVDTTDKSEDERGPRKRKGKPKRAD